MTKPTNTNLSPSHTCEPSTAVATGDLVEVDTPHWILVAFPDADALHWLAAGRPIGQDGAQDAS